MTKESSSEILGVKMEIFPEKASFRNLGPRKKFVRPPQTRHQVSATAYNIALYEALFLLLACASED